MRPENSLSTLEHDEIPGKQLMVEGHTLQQIRSPFALSQSVQQPRAMARVKKMVLDEAAMAGEDFYYSWRIGKDLIEGIAIEGALILARCWGNCAVPQQPVQELYDAWVFTASFVDLETGFTLDRQFRMSKAATVHGRLDEERKADMRFQIGQSKAIRNVVLNALPAWLKRAALAKAKEGVMASLERAIKDRGIVAIQDASVRALAKFGVKEPAILAKFGVAERGGLSNEHLVILKGDFASIERGESRAEELYPESPVNRTEQVAGMIQTQPKPAEAAAPASTATPPAQQQAAPAPARGKKAVSIDDVKAQIIEQRLDDPDVDDLIAKVCKGEVKHLMDLTPDELTAFRKELDKTPTKHTP